MSPDVETWLAVQPSRMAERSSGSQHLGSSGTGIHNAQMANSTTALELYDHNPNANIVRDGEGTSCYSIRLVLGAPYAVEWPVGSHMAYRQTNFDLRAFILLCY